MSNSQPQAPSSGLRELLPALAGLPCMILIFLVGAVITPLLDTLIRQPFGLTNQQSSSFLYANALATILFAVPAGLLLDRFARPAVLILISMIGNGICTCLIPLLDHYPVLLVVRFLQGIFDITAQVVLIAAILKGTSNRVRALSLSVISIGLPLAYLVGPIASTLLADRLPVLFASLGFLLAGSGVLYYTLSDSKHRFKAEASSGINSMLLMRKMKGLFLPLLVGFVDKFTFGTLAILASFAPGDLFQRTNPGAVGLLLVLFWSGFLVFLLPAGRATDRIGLLPGLIFGSVGYGVCLLLMGFSNYHGLALLMLFAGCLSPWMYLPSIALVGQLSNPDDRGFAMGGFNLVGTAGMILGFATAGYLTDRHYPTAFAVPGVLEIILGVALFLFGRRIITKISIPADSVVRA